MIENTCGLLDSYRWFLHIYHHLLVAFIKYVPHTSKCIYAISSVATFWQSKNICHNLWSDPHIFIYSNFCLSVKTVVYLEE
jgi:hypothetical protein